MTIAVLGPGAMGCLLAGRLGAAGEEVLLLDSDPARAEAIGREGVRIVTAEGRRTVAVQTTSDPSSAPGVGLLIVAVKAYDTEGAIDQWRGAVGPETILLTLQNGLGNVEALLSAFPSSRVIGGTTSEGSTLDGPGTARHAGSGETVLAAARGGREAAEAAAAPLDRAGFSVRVEDDVEAVIWAKLLTNVGVNALAGLLGVSNGDLGMNEDVRPVIRDLIGEASEVALRKGVRLPPGDAADRAGEVLRKTAGNINSLLQDLRAGRRTEIGQLNGKIVEEGEALGVPTPVNRVLWRLVRGLEAAGSAP